MKQPQRLGDDSSSRLAELQHAPPAWKFCAVQSQERFDRENAQRADRAKMNGRRFFDCRKWKTTARPRKTLPGSPDQGKKNQRAQEEPSRDHPQGPRGSGSAPRLPSWGCAGTAGCPAASATRRLSSCLAADGGHALGLANKWVFERSRRSRTRPSIQTWIRTAKQLETCGKYRELKRKLSERALTQRKARAREEPSPGPPASETDARPPGHQPRGGAPARPRLSRGQEGPT